MVKTWQNAKVFNEIVPKISIFCRNSKWKNQLKFFWFYFSSKCISFKMQNRIIIIWYYAYVPALNVPPKTWEEFANVRVQLLLLLASQVNFGISILSTLVFLIWFFPTSSFNSDFLAKKVWYGSGCSEWWIWMRLVGGKKERKREGGDGDKWSAIKVASLYIIQHRRTNIANSTILYHYYNIDIDT